MLECVYEMLFDEPITRAIRADLQARFTATESGAAALQSLLHARKFAAPLRFDEFQQSVPIADVVDNAYRAILERPADPPDRRRYVEALASRNFAAYDMYCGLLDSEELALRKGDAPR